MSGVNKVIILGRLGQDPEVRFMPSGGAVANLSVATSEKWKDKQTGEAKEKTEWHKVVLFGNTAEIAGKYLKKGSNVYLEGQLQTRKWQDQQGQDKYTTEVVVQGFSGVMQMLDSKPQGSPQQQAAPQQAPAQQGGYQQPPQQQAPAQGGFHQPPQGQNGFQQPQQTPQAQGQSAGGYQPNVNQQAPNIGDFDDIPY